MVLVNKLSIDSPLSSLSGVGAILAQKFTAAGIQTIRDLLYYFPFRYEDLTNTKKLAEVEIDEQVSLQANIWQINKLRTARGKVLIKATIADTTSTLDVAWFNQEYLLNVLKVGQSVNFSGKVALFGRKKTLMNPIFELSANGQVIHTQGLVPIYSETKGLTKKFLRSKIYQLIFKTPLNLVDTLPREILEEKKLPPLEVALRKIHFPKSLSEAVSARKRFAYEELLVLNLVNVKLKEKFKKQKTQAFKIDLKSLEKLKNKLSFELTQSQKTALKEIYADLALSSPMNRLLQGEVGSGKTIVSTFALKICLDNGMQAAFMAPTEILAQQHYLTIKQFLGEDYSIGLATGNKKLDLESAQLIIGTHALLSKNLNFDKLGLIVVDEQQRFGVLQRQLLREKGINPHFLSMTATPIPRTLALTMFGDLQISNLEELPSERKKVKTYLVPRIKRENAYEFIRKQINLGDQVIFICPLIEPSESLDSVKAALSEYQALKENVFPEKKLGLLHGKLSGKEKGVILDQFRDGVIDILVATPVVEVGIDIPNATIIVIEAAERFGLASLHQLRGRVGRGQKQSYCLIFTEKDDPKTLERLSLLQKNTSGFYLSEADLKLRGAGNIYGTLQSGHFRLKLADAINADLISQAQTDAKTIIQNGLSSALNEAVERNLPILKTEVFD